MREFSNAEMPSSPDHDQTISSVLFSTEKMASLRRRPIGLSALS
jgi:hypothetical protein